MAEIYDTLIGHICSLRQTLFKAFTSFLLAAVAIVFFYDSIVIILLSPLKHLSQSYPVKKEIVTYERLTNESSQPQLIELSPNFLAQKDTSFPKKYNLAPSESILVEHVTSSASLAILTPMEGLTVSIKIVVFGSILLSSPLWLYLLYDFISPAFRYKEKFLALFFLISFLGVMVLTSIITYMTLLPWTLRYFFQINALFGENLWSLKFYFDFVLQLLFAASLSSELVLFIFFTVHQGWLKAATMKAWRRHTILGVFIAASIITPPDIFSQLALALPMLLFYELIIIYAMWREKRFKAAFSL